MELDALGNLYISGHTNGALPGQVSLGGYDVFVRKYDSNGNEIWTRQFGSSTEDYGSSLTIDSLNNPYVLGTTMGALSGQTWSGGRDVFVVGLDSGGNEVWTQQFGGSLDDYAYGLTRDASDNLYLGGETLGSLPGQTSAGGRDDFLRKMSPNGNELWTRQFGTDLDDFGARTINFDNHGNLYFVGTTSGSFPGQTSAGGRDLFVSKYDPSGAQLLIRQMGGSGDESARAAGTDSAGNLYLAGDTTGTLPGQVSAGATDAFGARFSSDVVYPGVPVVTDPEDQQMSAVSGNLVVWADTRNGNNDIYMKDLSTGIESPIVTDPASQSWPHIQGNKVVWTDGRNGNNDVYLKDLSTGLESAVCMDPAQQYNPDVYGNKVVWQDYRAGNYDIYMKDLSTGVESLVCTETGNQIQPRIFGNIVVWQDGRSGTTSDVYMKDLSTGVESAVSTASGSQNWPHINGSIVAWYDNRNGNYDIYMKDLSTGIESPVSATAAEEINPEVYGNIIVWDDNRNGDKDVYMKNVSTGVGAAVCVAPGDQWNAAISGNVVTWSDFRNGNWDIYMETVSGLPTAIISSPTESQTVSGVVSVTGTATGQNFGQYTLDYGCGTSPTAWRTIATSSTPVTDGVLGSWDTTSLDDGLYVLRLTVTDSGGGSSSASVNVRVENRDYYDLLQLTTDQSSDSQSHWSPDGTKILFTSNRGDIYDNIWIMNSDGSGQALLVNAGNYDRTASWSPDGTKIAWSVDGNIWVMNADGTGQTQVTFAGGYEWYPAWSPDGTKIAIRSNAAGNDDVWVMNSDGTNMVQLTTDIAPDTFPSWNSDGTKIVFRSDRTGNSDIWVMNADGSNQTQLTTDLADDATPSVSPEGSKIAFNSERAGTADLWIMNFDGSAQTRITFDIGREIWPRWSPDGLNLAFMSDRADAAEMDIWTITLPPAQVYQGVPVATGPADQQMSAVSGNIVVWTDKRSGNNDIYMKDLSTGIESPIVTDPASQSWPHIQGNKVVWTDGRNGNNDVYLKDLSTGLESAVCMDPAQQYNPDVYGNKVVWQDYRAGNYDIYMKDLSTGVESLVCTETGNQIQPRIFGNIVVWQDGRSGTTSDVYMKDLSTGVESAVSTASGSQNWPHINGSIVAWYDNRNGNYDIYMKDLSTGIESPVSTTAADEINPEVYGNIIVWDDNRNGDKDVFMKNVSTGVEAAVCVAPEGQLNVAIDGNVVTWSDFRNGNWDIYMETISGLPTAVISSPAESQTVSGTVSITGTATGEGFSQYTVEYGCGTSPSAWRTIASSTTPVTDGLLASWDTAALDDGLHVVRLTSTDASGNTNSASVSVRTENREYYDLTQLTTDPSTDSQPDWSPDGSKILFCSTRGGTYDIWMMNSDGSNQALLINKGTNDRTAAWSPDGTKIAWAVDGDIWIMNADTTNQVQITSGTSYDWYPAWSPDGTKIAFRSNGAGNEDVWVMNADGTNITQLTTDLAADTFPSWNADGTRIAFLSLRSGNSDIWVMNSDGTNQTQLTTDLADDSTPRISPDGTKIAFYSERAGTADLWIMNFDGSHQERITIDPGREIWPRWSPDGLNLVFMSDRASALEMDLWTITLPPPPPTRCEESNPSITWTGTWNNYSNANYSGGATKYTNSTGASATLAFNGTSVTLLSCVTSNRGIAKVYIDGVYQQDVDLYSATTQYQKAVYTKTGLTSGAHTIKIEVAGTKNASSTNTYVDVDAFDVVTPPDTTPPTQPSSVTASAPSSSQIDLTWTASTDNIGVVGYRVERGSDGITFSEVGTAATASYSDTGLAPATTYYYRVRAYDAAGNLSDYSGIASATTLSTAPTRYEESSPSVAWTGTWTNYSNASYSGGATKYTNSTGASATLTFSGTSVTFLSCATSNRGIAKVYIDGVYQQDVDLYSATTQYQKAVYTKSGLTSGAHTIKIEVSGIKNPSSSNYYVDVDAFDVSGQAGDTEPPTAPSSLVAGVVSSAEIDLSWVASADNIGVAGYRVERSPDGINFIEVGTTPSTTYPDTGLSPATTYHHRVRAYDAVGNQGPYSNVAAGTTPAGPTRYEESSPSVAWTGTWTNYSNASYSGGATKYTNSTGASATFSFSGSWVSFISCVTSNRGIARVYIDGVYQQDIDLYSGTTEYQKSVYTRSGLASGTHTIKIEVAGTKNPSSSNTYVDVDAFDVGGQVGDTTPPTPPSSLAATAISSSQIDLSWVASIDNIGVAGYRVERGIDGVNFTEVGTTASTAYSDTGLSAGATYYYRVRAYDAAGNLSDYSNIASATTLSTPPTRYEESSPSIAWTGTWNPYSNASYSGGATKYTNSTGASATLTFNGTSVTLLSCVTSNRGIAKVYIDGVYQQDIDLYSATTQYQKAVYSKSGLTSGAHTIRIEVTGTKNASSSNSYVDVDAFDVI
jgi:beta propeller repeat protein